MYKRQIDSYIGIENEKLDLDETDLLAPIESPSKFLAIGLNYKKHRQETIDAGIHHQEIKCGSLSKYLVSIRHMAISSNLMQR